MIRTIALLFTLHLGLGWSALAHAQSSAAASPRYDLGVVLDVRRPHLEGVTVLAITPGGGAERMRLLPGDRILSVNEVALDTLTPSATLQEAIAARAGQVRIEALRKGRRVVVEGRADGSAASDTALQSPQASAGCGYLTEQGPTPRLSEKVFDAGITQIDGRSTPLYPVNRHQVQVGRHVLVVREQIDPTRFSSVQRLQREQLLRLRQARAYKVLIVDVAADTKYHVGARLLPEQMDGDGIRDNQYWEPVVWKQVGERCR